MPSFQDIPQFTKSANYAVDVPWTHLQRYVAHLVLEYGFDANPPFQRAHVWNAEQKSRYIEYVLRGGDSGRSIYANAKNWNRAVDLGPFVLVDGKQRLDAVLGFLNDEVPAFGHAYSEYTGVLRITQTSFRWHINDLATYEEVLQWYVDLNDGGVVHTRQEIDKVKTMLDAKQGYKKPETEDLWIALGGHSREGLKQAKQTIEDERANEKARAEVARNAAREAIAKGRKGKRK